MAITTSYPKIVYNCRFHEAFEEYKGTSATIDVDLVIRNNSRKHSVDAAITIFVNNRIALCSYYV